MDRLKPLAALALVAAARGASPEVRPAGTYELRSVAGRALPAAYGVLDGVPQSGVTLLAAAITFVPGGDSAVVRVTVRPRILETWPCEALRAMRSDEAGAGTGGMSASPADTGRAGCDALRLEHDTTWARVRTRGDSLELRPDSSASQLPPLRGTLRRDTLSLRVPAGPADSLEVWTFVRSAARPST